MGEICQVKVYLTVFGY